ncbi:unnamed protein product, partial [marine sediment metagenome]
RPEFALVGIRLEGSPISGHMAPKSYLYPSV